MKLKDVMPSLLFKGWIYRLLYCRERDSMVVTVKCTNMVPFFIVPLTTGQFTSSTHYNHQNAVQILVKGLELVIQAATTA
jgi:hypothetical protein